MDRVKLGDVAHYVTEKVSVTELTEANYIGVDNLLPNKAGVAPADYLPQEGFATTFIPGDVLIGNIRPYFKKIWLADRVGGCSNDVLCIRSNGQFSGQALYAFLSQDSFFDYDTTGAKGSKMPRGDKAHIMNYPLLQNVDAEFAGVLLKTLGEKLSSNKKLMTELEETARLIYDYWFTQFDFPDENGNPYRSSGGAMVYNETLHREIPEGWNIVTLEEIAEINRGVSYSSSNLSDSGTPMINLASFSPGGEYLVDGIKYYVGDYSEDKKLRPYDLVICNTQQTALDPSKDIIGKSLLVPDLFSGEILSSHHVTTVNVSDDRLKSYLFAFFRSAWFNSYITGFASGTSILGLDNKGLLATPILIPCERVLEKFAKYQLCIERNKNRFLKEDINLLSLRDWLLPMLMNGQILVGD